MVSPATFDSVTFTRELGASPEAVFAAWTDPARLMEWFGPFERPCPVTEVDLRPGGRYRLGARNDAGETFVVGGTYLAVEPPRKLVFTWEWEPAPHHAMSGRETLVTVEIEPRGTGSRLVLTHERFHDESAARGHEHGWTASLLRMERLLAGNA